MPSDRRQIAVRLDDATCAVWDKLHEVSAEKMGVALSQPQVFALALAALAEKWKVTPVESQPATAPATPGTRRRKSD